MCKCRRFDCEDCSARYIGKIMAAAVATSANTAFDEGEEVGYDIGHTEGRSIGYDLGNAQGFQLGAEKAYGYGDEFGFNRGNKSGYSKGHFDGQQKGHEDGVAHALEVFADDINGTTLTDDIYNQGMEDAFSMVYDNAKGYLLANGDFTIKVGEIKTKLPDGFEYVGTMNAVVTYAESGAPKNAAEIKAAEKKKPKPEKTPAAKKPARKANPKKDKKS